ncbi:hypothetical protein SH203_02356 [Brevundimonas sp. SH203]|uniref:DUF418 domain-containing protein n=1 Tax=Brevundimonas sp. SH203 TaxID=345167 RepID=UPI0009CC08EF|nr:DUF418 domain-containing protein [Brevundimonas sp. SH203]GAW41944.1 hypothetical protein SH203_02356 [Brevundimonas sp. SH203]
MPQPDAPAGPVVERIATLDLVRGLAVLGILAVNAAGFAAPLSAYGGYGLWPFPETGASTAAQWVVDTLFHQKFIALFSMLFGASLFLVGGERADVARGRRLRRRLFWLAVIALVHGLAIWWGDVLLLYAWSGLFVMLARSWRPVVLFRVGLVLFIAFSLIQVAGPLALYAAPADVQARIAAELTPSAAQIAQTRADIADAAGSLAGAYRQNFSAWLELQSSSLMVFVFPTVGLMMIGLGLFKTGFLSGSLSARLYRGVAAAGALALAAVCGLSWLDDMAEARMMWTAGVEGLLNPLIGLGYASLLILMWKAGRAGALKPLAAAGRMALSNYLAQSILMTSLFWGGRGLGLMGQVDRPMLWGIVIGVWVLQLIWSPLWLSRFEMGPAEWLWRCLTYGRRLPMRKPA